ncbi:hypothetical protein FGB62_201g01 [Gracilaria domingensis]|nr:hypothetical protein FGB62_201g01 [Gracilaria domingensis]
MPKTAGRWLYTSNNCGRQMMHIEFPALDAEETVNGSSNPGCSQTSACNYTANGASSRSVFVGRGDVYHGGTYFEEFKTRNSCIRYHMYFVPKGYELPDGIHSHPLFKPKHYSECTGLNMENEIGDEVEEENIESRYESGAEVEDNTEQIHTSPEREEEHERIEISKAVLSESDYIFESLTAATTFKNTNVDNNGNEKNTPRNKGIEDQSDSGENESYQPSTVEGEDSESFLE